MPFLNIRGKTVMITTEQNMLLIQLILISRKDAKFKLNGVVYKVSEIDIPGEKKK